MVIQGQVVKIVRTLTCMEERHEARICAYGPIVHLPSLSLTSASSKAAGVTLGRAERISQRNKPDEQSKYTSIAADRRSVGKHARRLCGLALEGRRSKRLALKVFPVCCCGGQTYRLRLCFYRVWKNSPPASAHEPGMKVTLPFRRFPW